MAIKLNRYVDITSVVGASANVGTRQLIGRFYDDNALIPTNSDVEFDNLDDVGNYFGTDTEEYSRAAFWFGWVSKNGTDAQSISFARWASAATAPQIFGAIQPQTLNAWKAITAGSFTLALAGTSHTLTAMDFSGANSLADVAGVIQTKIRAQATTMWTGATVTYDPVRGSFNFTGGVTGANSSISVTAGTGGADVAAQLGWLSPSAILSDGIAVQSITDVLNTSANANNNFGSFTFIADLAEDQILEAATWNAAQDNMFLYSVRCTSANATDLQTELANINDCTLTLCPITTEYPEQVPMMIMSSTDYNAVNSTQNYMFQIFNLTPSVTTDADADTYDALKINYYGQTQTAGQLIQFYQRGFMQGLPNSPLYQNVYANEVWLKDAAGAAIMTVLLSQNKIPANAAGRAKILNILQGVINQALSNGTISVGKALNVNQQLYITNATGDPDAWRQVQNIGYWVDVQIVTAVVDGITVYKAVYTLIYSKDDVILKVEGSDILI